MYKFGKAVVKLRVPILIVGILLLVPSIFGYLNTGINYDMLTYLPKDMDTVEGQDVLLNDFGKGAFSLIVTEGVDDTQVKNLTDEIRDVDHVADAISYGEIASAQTGAQAAAAGLNWYVDALNNQVVGTASTQSSAGTGLTSAVEDARALNAGATQLDDGTGQLDTGLAALLAGSKTLAGGTAQLYDGASQLADGARQAADGSVQDGKSYNNFCGITSGTEGHVKFIYKTDAINKD